MSQNSNFNIPYRASEYRKHVTIVFFRPGLYFAVELTALRNSYVDLRGRFVTGKGTERGEEGSKDREGGSELASRDKK